MGYGIALYLYGDVHFLEFMNCTIWLLYATAAYWMPASEMTFALHKLDFTTFNSIKFVFRSLFPLLYVTPSSLLFLLNNMNYFLLTKVELLHSHAFSC